MKIKLDDKHFLNSDKYCYYITGLVEVKKGDNAGKIDERRVSGYYSKFEDVVASYIEKHLKSLECETVSELSKEIESLKKTVKKWKCVVEKEQ